MDEINNEQNLISLNLENGDFEKGSGSRASTGWIGDEKYNVYQIIDGDVNAITSFDNTVKESGNNSLKVQVQYFNNKQSSLYLRMNLNLDTIHDLSEIKNQVNKIKVNLSFYLNSKFYSKIIDHKVYLTKSTTESTNVKILNEIEIDLDTNGEWHYYSKEIYIEKEDLEHSYYIYIIFSGAESDFKGECNFDNFQVAVKGIEYTNPLDNIQINQVSFQPIPHDFIPCIGEFLNLCGVGNNDIVALTTDPSYPFAALNELWRREGLDYERFILFVRDKYPLLENNFVTYLNEQGVYISSLGKEQEEITLAQAIEKEYGESTSNLIIFYIKVLLASISKDPESLIDKPISDSLSSLLAIVQTIKENATNIDQLRTLDLIETVLLKYSENSYTPESVSNTLTPEEKLNNLPSLEDTNKVIKQSQISAIEAISQLIDTESVKKLPKYEFRIGGTPLANKSQQKMNFVMDVLNSIDKDKGQTNYAKWIPGFFSAGGGVVNEILAENTQYNLLEQFFKNSINQGLDNYSTLDANPQLKEFLSSSLAKEIAEKRYSLKGNFKNLGELAGGILAAFIPEKDREKDDFETFFINKTKGLTEKAIKEGFTDQNGNYHEPLNTSSDIKDFITNTAPVGALEGFKESFHGLNSIPTNLTQAVGVNPLGDFYKNSLGSVFFPDSKKGLANLPFEYSPSIPSRVSDGLKDYLPSNSINALNQNIFNNPQNFKNTRFDGSFANNPDFQKSLKDGGISNFRLPQVKDSINSAFFSNNFDKSLTPLSKLSTIGNQYIGGLDKRLNVPFNSNNSPFSNILSAPTAPFNSVSNLFSKSNIPFIPSSQKFLDNIYGPAALAAKGIALPTNYSPETLSKLMQYEAPFKNQVNPIFFSTPSNYQYNPQQLQQLREYQNALSQKGSAPLPSFIPQYVEQNRSNFTPQQLKQFQEYQRAMGQSRGAVPQPPSFAQQDRNTFTPQQLKQYQEYQKAMSQSREVEQPQFVQQMLDPNSYNQAPGRTQQNRLTPEQIEQYKKYQQAKKNGSYGKNRPKQSGNRNAYKGAQDTGQKAKNGANQVPVSGLLAGGTVGFALGAPVLAIPFSFLGAGSIKIISSILGTERNKFKEFINQTADFAGVTANFSSTLLTSDSFGNGNTKFVPATTLWNRTFGKVFGIDYELGGLYIDQSDPTNPSNNLIRNQAKNFLSSFSQFNLLAHTYAMSAYTEIDPTKKLDYINAANSALQARRNYFKFFNGVFSDDKYKEMLGEDPTVVSIDRGIGNANLQYDTFTKSYTIDNAYVTKDPSKTLPSLKGFSKLSRTLFNVRSSAGGVWEGFLGLAAPLRGGNTGFAGAFDYFFINVPKSITKISSSIYSLLPKDAKRFILIGFGGANPIQKRIIVGYEDSLLTSLNRVKMIPIRRVVLDKSRLPIIEGYSSTLMFELFYKHNWFINAFKKAGNVERKGFRRLLFGRLKKASYTNWDLKNIGLRAFFKGPGFLTGRISKGLHFLTNPAQYIQSKLKQFFINILKNIIKKVSELAFEGFKKAVVFIFKQIGIKVAEGLLLSIGVIVILLFIFLLIAIIGISSIATSYRAAYANTNQSASTGVVGILPICNSTNITLAYDEEGKAVPAHILNVPYFNEKRLDPNVKNVPDVDRQGRITGDTVSGGGNMCGAASTGMVAGYFDKLPINGNSTILQDYMYMDKGQGAKYSGVANPLLGCTSTAEGTAQTNVKGVYYNIASGAYSGSSCNFGTDWGKMITYLNNLGISLTEIDDRLILNKNSRIDELYAEIVKTIDQDKIPLIMSMGSPLEHIDVIVGYTYDSTGKANGVVMNDPYANLQKKIDKNLNLDYTIGNQSSNSSSGDKPIYHLENPNYGIKKIWKAVVPASTARGNCPTPTNPIATDDHIIASVWRHRQNNELSCEFASLATAFNAVGVDLGINAPNETKIVNIENKIIIDNSSFVDKSIPTFDKNGNITQWSNPDNSFVGNLNLVGVNVNPSRKIDSSGKFILQSPDPTTGLTILGYDTGICNNSLCGYGTYAPVINNITQTYSNKGIKVDSELLPRSPNNGQNNLQKLYDAVDKNEPAIVWTTTYFETIGTDELKAIQDERSKGLFKWTDSKDPTKKVDAIPHEHAVVFMGYNKMKNVVYLMDVYKNSSNKIDNPDPTSGKVEISVDRFMQNWDLFDYQGVIIKKK